MGRIVARPRPFG